MKIKNLYTLTQFIEIMIFGAKGLRNATMQLLRIRRYIKFLKQPLTEEMVFNKLKKPIYIGDKGCYSGCTCRECHSKYSKHIHDYSIWEAAEKKVIFENVIVEPVGDVWRIGRYWVQSEKNGAIFLFDNETKEWIPTKTLHDLAEKTNGGIELKNVEI